MSASVTAMMRAMRRVFVSRDLPFPALDRLRAEHEVDVWEERTPPPPEELLERAQRADALLTTVTERVDGDLFDAAPSVRAVANLAVGTDNIDLEAAAERGIPVGNTPDVLTDATADIAFALLLAVARRIIEGEREVREGRWAAVASLAHARRRPRGPDARDRRLGPDRAGDGAPRRGLRDEDRAQLALVRRSRSRSCSSRPTTCRSTRR